MNFVELQLRIDRGELTLDECRRIGATHKAYGWSPTGTGGRQSAEQAKAYLEGYKGVKDVASS